MQPRPSSDERITVHLELTSRDTGDPMWVEIGEGDVLEDMPDDGDEPTAYYLVTANDDRSGLTSRPLTPQEVADHRATHVEGA